MARTTQLPPPELASRTDRLLAELCDLPDEDAMRVLFAALATRAVVARWPMQALLGWLTESVQDCYARLEPWLGPEASR